MKQEDQTNQSKRAQPNPKGSQQRMDGRQEESAGSGVPFGDTQCGENLGCAAMILAVGITVALIAWAAQ